MKNEYEQPTLSVVDVEVITMLAASKIWLGSDQADEELSNGSRGSWDDLWE